MSTGDNKDPRLSRFDSMVEGIVESDGGTTFNRQRSLSNEQKSLVQIVDSMKPEELRDLIKMAESKLLRKEQAQVEEQKSDEDRLASFLKNNEF